MSFIRRCLGCSATYVADGHLCEECGSHAGEVEEAQAPEDTTPKNKPKPRRQRKT
jgi:rRNA maturation endonuclease Nob1